MGSDEKSFQGKGEVRKFASEFEYCLLVAKQFSGENIFEGQFQFCR
jgi:hypothetical protein